MSFKHTATLALFVFGSVSCMSAQEAPAAPQITMGNGTLNMIETSGMTRVEDVSVFSEVRVDEAALSTFRANSTAITFPEVTVAQNSWLVLHPVIDGRPDGDMVSGYTYLGEGTTEGATIQIDHPADAGDQFLVMLHKDVDEDRVFDFVFVEDGINVEDTAVFEGNRMVSHVISVP
ncbi:MAG: hypothetical protein AAF768_10820 [Pseudomonadota bacterium]